jgi:tripartite-type tricarboxylate transporter receptor subunit TctC
MIHGHLWLGRIARFALAAAVGLAALTNAAAAADWTPNRPIRLIVPSTPGAGGDLTARLFSERLATGLGQPVIVDNKGGAGGIIGADAAAKSPPDGYTMVLGSDYAFTIHPQLGKTPYDPIKDFEPVSLIANLPMVLVVNPQRIPATTVKELIALVKANPGKYSIASAGNGSSHHIAAESFKYRAGVDLLHVPYKGAAEAMNAVLSGQTDILFVSSSTALPQVKAGKVKALGISTARRLAALPDVPTIAEAGVPNFDIGIWFGFFYPARTPKVMVDRVNVELQKILDMPDVRARLNDMGYTPAGGKPEILKQRLEDDSAKYRKLVQDANIKLD